MVENAAGVAKLLLPDSLAEDIRPVALAVPPLLAGIGILTSGTRLIFRRLGSRMNECPRT
jgi:hypothetical protein